MTSVLAVGMKSLHIQQTWYTLFCVIIISQSEFLQENERQNSMGSKSGIVWCEAFPQAEETFTTNKLEKSILWQSIKYTQWQLYTGNADRCNSTHHSSFVFWFTVNNLHVLYSVCEKYQDVFWDFKYMYFVSHNNQLKNSLFKHCCTIRLCKCGNISMQLHHQQMKLYLDKRLSISLL